MGRERAEVGGAGRAYSVLTDNNISEAWGVTPEDEAIASKFAQGWIGHVRGHPRFDEAVRHCVDGALALADQNTVFMDAVKDIGRFFGGIVCLYLHATPGGLTVGRLRAFCATTSYISPGAADALLIHLRLIGYVERAPFEGDSRVRLFRPTERAMEIFTERLGVEVTAAGMMAPQMAPFLARWREPEVFLKFMRHFGAVVAAGEEAYRVRAPSLDVFLRRNAGAVILFALIAASRNPQNVARLSVASLAQRFRVSRTHVTRLLRDAEADGLIIRSAETVEIFIQPVVHTLLASMFEMLFGWEIACSQFVLYELAAKDPRGVVFDAT